MHCHLYIATRAMQRCIVTWSMHCWRVHTNVVNTWSYTRRFEKNQHAWYRHLCEEIPLHGGHSTTTTRRLCIWRRTIRQYSTRFVMIHCTHCLCNVERRHTHIAVGLATNWQALWIVLTWVLSFYGFMVTKVLKWARSITLKSQHFTPFLCRLVILQEETLVST